MSTIARIEPELLFPEINPLLDADDRLILGEIKKYLENTDENDWCIDIYRSTDGTKHCVLSHIQKMMDDDETGMAFMERFETIWSNVNIIGLRANDGKDKTNYPQSTAKKRSIAFIEKLLTGEEDSTMTTMEKDYQHYLKMRNA